jgi:hypothetical protein
MEFQPNPTIPLLATDQAEVIQLFLELMSEDNHAERVYDAKATSEPEEPRFDSNDASFLGGMLDSE